MQTTMLSYQDAVQVEQALQIFRESFPENEKPPVALVRKRLQDGVVKLCTLCNADSQVAGMALFWELTDKFIFIDYLAVSSRQRGQGVGTTLLAALRQRAHAAGCEVILEVEDPEVGTNRQQRLRRIHFYLRCGLRLVNGMRSQVAISNHPAEWETVLLMTSLQSECLSADDLKVFLQALYQKVYHKGSDVVPDLDVSEYQLISVLD